MPKVIERLKGEKMAEFSYQDLEKFSSNGNQQVGFFGLKNDKDEAIVRFAFDGVEGLQFATVHNVTVNGKYRKASCLRTDLRIDPIEKCPLCVAGIPLQRRVFIKLIQYNLDERDANGKPTYSAKVWERSANSAKTFASMVNNYGPLSDMVFKIVRNGVAGDTKTTYDILPCMPNVYNPELYVKDFSAFDNYSVIGTVVIKEDANGLSQILNGTWQPKSNRDNGQQTTTYSVPNNSSYSTASTDQVIQTVSYANNSQPTTNNWGQVADDVAMRPKRTYNY